MANTGAPYFIPYVEPTDLVRDYPAADEASADAIAAALDAAGGLVAVKSAIFTGIQSASVTARGRLAITDLSIAHAVSDPANRVILFSTVNGGRPNLCGGVIQADGSDIVAPASPGSRATAFASNQSASNDQMASTSVTIVHTPGSTASVTYTAAMANLAPSTLTVNVNRGPNDTNNADNSRTVSTLMLMEVKV